MRRSLIFVPVLAVIAAACGGSSQSTTTVTTTVAPAVTTTVSAATPTSEAPVPADPDRTPADGDTVGVFYTGTLDDGEQFDSNVGGAPLTFVVGSGQVISGFDDAVRGLKTGESITVRLEPADAYGEHDPELILELPAEGAPADLAVGDSVRLSNGQPVTILEIRSDIIVVDANPRLAGQALTFVIELVSIS